MTQKKLTMREALSAPGAIYEAIGLALCFAVRDIPQFISFEALNTLVSTQYLIALGRCVPFALLLVLIAAKSQFGSDGKINKTQCACAIGAAFLTCLGLAMTSWPHSDPWQLVGHFMLGLGQSAFLASWIIVIFRRPRRTMFYLMFFAMILAGSLEVTLAFFQLFAMKAIAVALPFFSLALQLVSFHLSGKARRVESAENKEHKGNTQNEFVKTSSHDDLARITPSMLLPLLVFSGYSFIARQLTDTWMGHGTLDSLFLYQCMGGLGTALAGVLVLILFRLRKPYKISAVYAAFVIPPLSIALYLSTFLTGLSSMAYVPLLFIFRKMILFMAFVASLNKDKLAARIRFFCWAFLFVEVGNLVQTAFFEFAKTLGDAGVTLSYLVVLLIISAIAIKELFSLLSRRTSPTPLYTQDIPSESDSFEKSSTNPPIDEATLLAERKKTALADIKCEYGLTERELEVLDLLLLGRNAEYIAKTLYIAHSTAKSHIAHIYQKTGINSQQRLMDEVAARIEDAEL